MGDIIRSERFTKMHNSQQLELFKCENLIKLIEFKQFEATYFWFLTTFAIMAMNVDNLSFQVRNFMLQSTFYFWYIMQIAGTATKMN